MTALYSAPSSSAVGDTKEELSDVTNNEPIKQLETLFPHLEINGSNLSAT